MNKNKILLIIIPIAIIVSTVGFLSYNQTTENIPDDKIVQNKITDELRNLEIKTDEEILKEIEKKYEQLEADKEFSEYQIREREWHSSGPFSIDRYEYALGEKIFLRAEGLQPNETGSILLLRPINQTHYSVWNNYSFDGNQKPAFSIYFEPTISKIKGVCERDDLLGNWQIQFFGTNYGNLQFSIFNQTVPGDEKKFSQKVC